MTTKTHDLTVEFKEIKYLEMTTKVFDNEGEEGMVLNEWNTDTEDDEPIEDYIHTTVLNVPVDLTGEQLNDLAANVHWAQRNNRDWNDVYLFDTEYFEKKNMVDVKPQRSDKEDEELAYKEFLKTYSPERYAVQYPQEEND